MPALDSDNQSGDSSLYKIQENISLEPYHTFGLPAEARFFCEIDNKQSLQALLKSSVFIENEPLFLGEGSNTLFTRDYPGLVVHLTMRGIRILSEDETSICVSASAGENWHAFVEYTLAHGYYGLENLSLIPGSVGAAPVQNIGAYGVEVKDFITHVKAVNVDSGEERIFENKECHFSYRDSCFKKDLKNRYVITSVSFRLSKQAKLMLSYAGLREGLENKGLTKPTPHDVAELICEIRQNKLPDPNKIGNAGSFFKNPIINQSQYLKLKKIFPEIKSFELKNNQYKIPAAWLIESCGFKGNSIGQVGVYEKQALVLINKGQASGRDIHFAVSQITEKVRKKFKIELNTEPCIL